MNNKISKIAHSGTLPPEWSIQRPKPFLQTVYDFITAPLRMLILPDQASESLHMTSLRAERFASVLPYLRGRVLDVGAGDNVLIRLYMQQLRPENMAAQDTIRSVGVDVVPWTDDVLLIDSADKLPFPDASFDTVCFIACINHIPERVNALKEVRRVLKPGGVVLVTMIGRFIGEIGHKLWWYSEDKHREVDHEELMGMDTEEVLVMLRQGGFEEIEIRRFLYGLNTLYIAINP